VETTRKRVDGKPLSLIPLVPAKAAILWEERATGSPLSLG
jgi:hypothetical protein